MTAGWLSAIVDRFSNPAFLGGAGTLLFVLSAGAHFGMTSSDHFWVSPEVYAVYGLVCIGVALYVICQQGSDIDLPETQ